MATSFDKIIGRHMVLMEKRLRNLKKTPFREMLASKKAVAGVYLVYDGSGMLFYVGSTGKTPQRFGQHMNGMGPLGECVYLDLLRARHVVPKRGHRCACGKEMECRIGDDLNESELAGIRADAYRLVLNTFQVSVIDWKGNYGVGRVPVENFVQWVLRPKYGYWAHLQDGRRLPIHDDPREYWKNYGGMKASKNLPEPSARQESQETVN